MTEVEKSKQPTAQNGESKATSDLSFLGNMPLLLGENPADYKRLLAMATDELKPADFIESVWVRDIVYLEWNIKRHRKWSVDLIESSYQTFITLAGESLQVNDKTLMRDRDIAAIAAQSIGVLERIDRMIVGMEARRNSTYREIERRKSTFRDRLQSTVKQIVDVEFNEVDDSTVERKRAA